MKIVRSSHPPRIPAARALASGAVLLVAGAMLAACTSSTSSGSTSSSPSATSSDASGPSAEAGANLAVITPTTTCAALAKAKFSAVGTTITSATTVSKSSGGAAHSYCDVKGTVSPQIGFELLMPLTTYRQRYLQEGCEGLCGMTSASVEPSESSGCAAVSDGTFVIGQDDEGHTSSGGLGGTSEPWAAKTQLRVDFGYRSEGAFGTAAKAITKAFYGSAPKYSYYDGCSDGGRESLMVAQRYPAMFNGVIAGAPAFNQTALNGFEEAYLATIDFRADGSTIMPATKLPALHAAVIKECADPTLHDDTIQDPRLCHFDPASIQCATGTDTTSCLTAAQVAVVRKAYAGVTAPDGQHLYTGGEPYGSEDAWSTFIPAAGQGQSSVAFYGIGLSFVDYLEGSKPTPNVKLTSALFTVANLRAEQSAVSKIYDATNPDLSAFYEAGGKMIMWHGAADQYIPPAGSLAYRQAVIDKMGAATVNKFYRFYLFPSVNHCGSGDGPTSFNLLSPLLNWTENGTAPNAIIASKTTGGSAAGGPGGDGPAGGGNPLGGTTGNSGGGVPGPSGSGEPAALPSGDRPSGTLPSGAIGAPGSGASSDAGSSTTTTEYSRPVYPYPERVKYSGHGSVKKASSYVSYTPSTLINDRYKWAGTFLSSN